jgi:hypothetical protein
MDAALLSTSVVTDFLSQRPYYFLEFCLVQPAVVRHGGPRSTPLLVRSTLRGSVDESSDGNAPNATEAIPLAPLSPPTVSFSQSSTTSFEQVKMVSAIFEEDKRSQVSEMAAPVELAIQTGPGRDRQVMTPDSDYHTADQSPSSDVSSSAHVAVSQRGPVRALSEAETGAPAKAVQQLAMERLTAKLREEQDKATKLEIEVHESTQKAKRAAAQIKQQEKTIADLRRQLVWSRWLQHLCCQRDWRCFGLQADAEHRASTHRKPATSSRLCSAGVRGLSLLMA